MNDKKQPIVADVPKHRKKSKSKGRARSDHKHRYKTVILHNLDIQNIGKPKLIQHIFLAKVCEICGRILEMSWEEKKPYCASRQLFSDDLIEEKTKEFEHWCSYGFDNTAYRNIEDIPEYEKLKSLATEEM